MTDRKGKPQPRQCRAVSSDCDTTPAIACYQSSLIFKYLNKNGTNARGGKKKKTPFQTCFVNVHCSQSPSFKPTPPNFHYSLTALPFTLPWLSFSFLLCLGCQFPFLSGWLVLNERWVINGGTQGLWSPPPLLPFTPDAYQLSLALLPFSTTH